MSDHSMSQILITEYNHDSVFGITTLQVYMYYHHYQRDSYLHKLAVSTIYIDPRSFDRTRIGCCPMVSKVLSIPLCVDDGSRPGFLTPSISC